MGWGEGQFESFESGPAIGLKSVTRVPLSESSLRCTKDAMGLRSLMRPAERGVMLAWVVW